ncbi:enoyl-CoA hydratase/isomerase family [Podospora aff. communis PSN243]|uniref:Enoyl-CoA hydratase domain-containing protein 3, mitochondrial n=1 Tax=Podospora aff. communis PSN243 TaxID=3040156 RepID=A0AAV9GQ44_9PEZI|nr:enoyl-CoA hydratase/isomerase family [Podospora aff. communis PSN243]
MHGLPPLPANAAYLFLNNASRRNALSLSVLRDLSSQLKRHLTSPKTGRLLTLPPFAPGTLKDFQSSDAHRWLLDAAEWQSARQGLPNVLVLRSKGPVFSSGHDLKEVSAMSKAERKELFDACAGVMSLIRQSPAIVVGAVQGLATAAGFQLAMACDVAIARAETEFQLPGMSIGLPCTSPSTAVARRVPVGLAYRMFATAQRVRADELGGAVDVVRGLEEGAFERRVMETVSRLAEMPGQPQALGKWAFWSQAGIASTEEEDGFGRATRWASDAMVLHAGSTEAKEGMKAFLEKRKAKWST